MKNFFVGERVIETKLNQNKVYADSSRNRKRGGIVYVKIDVWCTVF